MYLIYFDESGNSGNNLNDRQQPVFVLCAMVVAESRWLPLERDLQAEVARRLPLFTEGDEIHGTDARSGKGPFSGMSVSDRVAFRNAWFDVATRHQVQIIYRAIEKRRYRQWLENTFGSGVVINPHVAAFALVTRVIDSYLKQLPGDPLGIFISDENREIVIDIDKSIRLLRGMEGKLRLGQIIEHGFFIDSVKSLPLQLCDLIALSIRKHEESRLGMGIKAIDEGAFNLIQTLIHRGNEELIDVVAWLTAQKKK